MRCFFLVAAGGLESNHEELSGRAVASSPPDMKRRSGRGWPERRSFSFIACPALRAAMAPRVWRETMKFRVQFYYDDKPAGFSDAFTEETLVEYFHDEKHGFCVPQETILQTLHEMLPGQKHKIENNDPQRAAMIIRIK
jgi:hypothetical protein